MCSHPQKVKKKRSLEQTRYNFAQTLKPDQKEVNTTQILDHVEAENAEALKTESKYSYTGLKFNSTQHQNIDATAPGSNTEGSFETMLNYI